MNEEEAMSAEPAWDEGGRVHNWKSYISDELADLWPTFTPEQRLAIARNADELAGREEWE